MPSIPTVTKAFILACVGTYCLFYLSEELQFGLQFFESSLELWPLQSGRFQPWQMISYAFLHANELHLFFNMLGLWMFGSELERVWGSKRYIQILVASTLSAAVVQLAFTYLMHSPSPTVGASGAIFGLLISFGMLFPDRIIIPLFPPIPMKAKYFVAIFGGLELLLGSMQGRGGGVAHFAHLGGMLGAWALIRFWRASRRR